MINTLHHPGEQLYAPDRRNRLAIPLQELSDHLVWIDLHSCLPTPHPQTVVLCGLLRLLLVFRLCVTSAGEDRRTTRSPVSIPRQSHLVAFLVRFSLCIVLSLDDCTNFLNPHHLFGNSKALTCREPECCTKLTKLVRKMLVLQLGSFHLVVSQVIAIQELQVDRLLQMHVNPSVS